MDYKKDIFPYYSKPKRVENYQPTYICDLPPNLKRAFDLRDRKNIWKRKKVRMDSLPRKSNFGGVNLPQIKPFRRTSLPNWSAIKNVDKRISKVKVLNVGKDDLQFLSPIRLTTSFEIKCVLKYVTRKKISKERIESVARICCQFPRVPKRDRLESFLQGDVLLRRLEIPFPVEKNTEKNSNKAVSSPRSDRYLRGMLKKRVFKISSFKRSKKWKKYLFGLYEYAVCLENLGRFRKASKKYLEIIRCCENYPNLKIVALNSLSICFFNRYLLSHEPLNIIRKDLKNSECLLNSAVRINMKLGELSHFGDSIKVCVLFNSAIMEIYQNKRKKAIITLNSVKRMCAHLKLTTITKLATMNLILLCYQEKLKVLDCFPKSHTSYSDYDKIIVYLLFGHASILGRDTKTAGKYYKIAGDIARKKDVCPGISGKIKAYLLYLKTTRHTLKQY